MGSDHTSDIQKRIYDFIVEYIRVEGMPPTNREIGSAMKIASTGHVDYHLSMLEKKGLIDREAKEGWLLERQIGRLRSLQNAPDQIAHPGHDFLVVRAVRH